MQSPAAFVVMVKVEVDESRNKIDDDGVNRHHQFMRSNVTDIINIIVIITIVSEIIYHGY